MKKSGFYDSAKRLGFTIIPYGETDEGMEYVMTKAYGHSSVGYPISRYRALAIENIGFYLHFMETWATVDFFMKKKYGMESEAGLELPFPTRPCGDLSKDTGWIDTATWYPLNKEDATLAIKDLYKLLGDEYSLDELDSVLDQIYTPDILWREKAFPG